MKNAFFLFCLITCISSGSAQENDLTEGPLDDSSQTQVNFQDFENELNFLESEEAKQEELAMKNAESLIEDLSDTVNKSQSSTQNGPVLENEPETGSQIKELNTRQRRIRSR